MFFLLPLSYSQELDPIRTVYVSSSLGDDRNDGSQFSPKQTLNGLPDNMRKNCHILLKKDDIFYENISGFDSCIIASYGEGRAPLICGFRKLNSNAHWEKEANNIWKIDLFRDDIFSGYSMPEGNSKWICHNIGFIYDETNDKIHGRLFRQKSLLKQRWDLFTSESSKPDQTFRFVYIFHENPKMESGTLCFPVYESGLSNLKNCHVSELAIQGFSIHGISDLDHCTVEDCAVDLIGGSIYLDRSADWFRFGNGIEFWIENEMDSANHNLIQNCWISRVYGCGASIQGTGATSNAVSNKFHNNVFYYCRQAFEALLEGIKGVDYIDCEFTGNICYLMGQNGFDSPKEYDANIYSDETSLHKNKIKMYHNFFWGSNHLFMNSKLSPLDMKYSVVFIFQGQYLNKYYDQYKPFIANAFLETNKYHEALKTKDYVYIINPEKEKNQTIQNFQIFLDKYFSQIDIRRLPDFKGLDDSLTMLRFVAGQREF